MRNADHKDMFIEDIEYLLSTADQLDFSFPKIIFSVFSFVGEDDCLLYESRLTITQQDQLTTTSL